MDINTSLKQEADHILHKLGLFSLLEKYGEVHVLGSYNLNTMVWRGLDISVLVPRLDEGTVFALLKDVGIMAKPTDLRLKNYTYIQSANGNKGRYIQCVEAHVDHITWDKIDIVISNKPEDIQEQITRNEHWKANIRADHFKPILEIKSALYAHPLYRTKITSVDIYQAVAFENIRTVEEFRYWLKKNKGIVA